MELPFFYIGSAAAESGILTLDEENSKHAVQVLRMEAGESMILTNGEGKIFRAEIVDAHKKKCSIRIIETQKILPRSRLVRIAVSPVKNNARFEWFLEKAAEMGVSEIVPLICSRTEKQIVKPDRLRGILKSAMLQSQQSWLTKLSEPVKFDEFISKSEGDLKMIAHCIDGQKISLKDKISTLQSTNQQIVQSTIVIGPEGDFTKEEIDHALENNFEPVSLGSTRLRTETAAMVAAALLAID